MKKAVSLVLLFLVSLTLSVGLVRLSMPIAGLRFTPHRLAQPPQEPAPIVQHKSDRYHCERGDWRRCLAIAEDGDDRGVLLNRAERLLERVCHGSVLPADVPATTKLEACGQLAAMRMERSPRLHAEVRECLAHALDDCLLDTPRPRCDLAEELPEALLNRPEWSRWCQMGDELACEIEEASYWAPSPT